MTLPKRDKPALAQWIVDERKRLGLKPDSLAAALTRLGYEVKDATVRGWEAGAKPGDDGIRAMVRLFESEPPTEGTDDLSRLIASNYAVADALRSRTEVDVTALLTPILAVFERQAERVNAILAEIQEVNVLQRELVLDLGRSDRERLERQGFQVLPSGTGPGKPARAARVRRAKTTNGSGAR